jgi:predicted ester cyclase
VGDSRDQGPMWRSVLMIRFISDSSSHVPRSSVCFRPPLTLFNSSPKPTYLVFFLLLSPIMSAWKLEANYRAYIALLDARNISGASLAPYVQSTVTRNGVTMSIQEYADLITDSLVHLPTLRFRINDLLVINDNIACRLTFHDGDAVQEGVQYDHDGKRISLERVSYRFNEEGKIKEVWSVIE